MRTLILASFFCFPAQAWWCEGHQVVALIAEAHLTPAALAGATALLKSQPVDPSLRRFCANEPGDPFTDASTWADDVKKSEQTGTWHYMDMPLGLKHGDPEQWCKPVGPVVNGQERSGCVLSALRYNLNILHNEKESDLERAKALRYLIHFAGDLHQPLHTTANNDQGGNCTPVEFLGDPKIVNLHSVWDGMIFNRDMVPPGTDLRTVASTLDRKFESKREGWIKSGISFDKWAWEGHEIVQKVTFGLLEPAIRPEPFEEAASCKDHSERYLAMKLKVTPEYQATAAPVVEQQLAKAGYRLAEVLNQIW